MKSVVMVVFALFSSLSFASVHFSSCGQRGKHGETPKYVILDEKPTIENLVATIKSNKSKSEKITDLTNQLKTITDDSKANAFCPTLVQNLNSQGVGYLEKCKRALVDKENIEAMAEDGLGDMNDLGMISCQFSLTVQMAITGF
jgi:hypothetical protein